MTTIRMKLIIGFAILTLFIVGLASLSINQIKSSSAAFHDYDHLVDYSILVNRVQANMLMTRLSFERFFLDPRQKTVDEFNHHYKTTSKYIDKARIEQSNIEVKYSEPLQAKKLDQIDSNLATYKRNFQGIQELSIKRNYLINEVLNIHGSIIQSFITDTMHSYKDDGDLITSYLAAEMLHTILSARLYATKFIKTDDAGNMRRVLYEFSHLDEQLITLQQKTTSSIRNIEINETKKSINIYTKAISELYETTKQRNVLIEISLFETGTKITDVSEDMSLTIIENQHNIDQMVKELNLNTISLMTIVAIIVSILAVMLAFFILRSISKDLLFNTQNNPTSIREVGMHAGEQRQDEVGVMGKFFNQLHSQLQSVIFKSNQVVKNISKGGINARITT